MKPDAAVIYEFENKCCCVQCPLIRLKNQMRREFPTVEAHSVRLMLLIGVLMSLCFSVGEGLRLLPLPHLPPRSSECVDARPHMTAQSASPRNQFQVGSITQPPPAQKNLKRKQTQWTPTSHCDLSLPNSHRLRSGAEWPTGFYLTVSASKQAGRAPPRTI